MARTSEKTRRPRDDSDSGSGTDGGTGSDGRSGRDAGDRQRGTARLNARGADDEKPHGRHGATARDGETEHGADEHARRNVNGVERLVSLAAGGALATYALRRKDWTALGLGVLGGALIERGVSGHCAVYGTLGLTSAADDDGGRRPRHDESGLTRQHGATATVDAKKAIKIERAFTINGRSPQDLYAYWRKLENLPRIFGHLERVTERDARRSHWEAKAPLGTTVAWDAEIINDVPGEIIAWRSLPGSQIPNAGAVNFREAPGGRGTEIKVSLEYEPPAGKLGAMVARLFGEEPAIQVREDLRRFKALQEAGEIPVSENPGQGPRAKGTFDAEVNRGTTGGDVRGLQREAAADAHQPRHQPTPADAERGKNTTHDYREPRA
jgi:uncharacterized membrane protein